MSGTALALSEGGESALKARRPRVHPGRRVARAPSDGARGAVRAHLGYLGVASFAEAGYAVHGWPRRRQPSAESTRTGCTCPASSSTPPCAFRRD